MSFTLVQSEKGGCEWGKGKSKFSANMKQTLKCQFKEDLIRITHFEGMKCFITLAKFDDSQGHPLKLILTTFILHKAT